MIAKKYKLIKEYPGVTKLGIEVFKSSAGIYENVDLLKKDIFNWREIEDFPEFWQEVIKQDYEILSFKQDSNITDLWTYFYNRGWGRNNKGNCETRPYPTLDAILNNHLYGGMKYNIHSVKRLSDGKIFTISDNLTEGIIKQFTLSNYNDGIYADTEKKHESGCSGYIGLPLEKWRKIKNPLFTTEDGVDIYEGDKYWFVNLDVFQTQNITAFINIKLKEECKRFSTKEKAEEYIIMNKPCLSINDIRNYKHNTTISGMPCHSLETFKELVKTKLK